MHQRFQTKTERDAILPKNHEEALTCESRHLETAIYVIPWQTVENSNNTASLEYSEFDKNSHHIKDTSKFGFQAE